MGEPTVWRKIVDSVKMQIAEGPQDPDSVARRIRDLRRGAPDGFGSLAISEALFELSVESRATA